MESKTARCKHENVQVTEVIAAMMQKIFEGETYYNNNEYGNLLYKEIQCTDCGKSKRITSNKKYPKWIQSRIDILDANDWN